MSNFRAIAAVTAALRNLIVEGFKPTDVELTTLPPDRARKAEDQKDQLNLYLYQITPNGAYRNTDVPRQVRPGETAQPPLALNLYYLLTAYAADDLKIPDQLILARAMSILHDHALLGREEIKKVGDNSGLDEQFERIRLTLQPLAVEDIFKLWSGFQTNYRLSAAYEATVVLIDSTQSPKAPLPVLTRGKEDQGVQTLLGSTPNIEEVRVPFSGAFKQGDDVRLVRVVPSAQLGDEMALLGSNLSGGSVRVVFRHTSLTNPVAPNQPNPLDPANPIEIEPVEVLRTSETELVVKLPPPGNSADLESPTAKFPAGVYTAQVITSQPGEPDRPSNEFPFSLAPTISLPLNPVNTGAIVLTITCAPMIRPAQRVTLLFRDKTIAPEPHTTLIDKLIFKLKNVPASGADGYVVRLRVDGVDSIPVDRSSPTPKFADNQKLKVT
jgi:hypothetical protein